MNGTKHLSPAITVPHDFHIDHIVDPAILAAANKLLSPTPPPPLGVLSHFTGTFTGKGFNLIFRPNSSATPTRLPNPNSQGPNDNILELNLTSESLAFSSPLGSVPNRGNAAQPDVFMNGVPYVQMVSDVTNGGAPIALHFEPGLWLAVPATTNPQEDRTLVRMGSIPHGTTINLQGAALPAAAGPPVIPPLDPTPFRSDTRTPFRFPSQTASNSDTFRIPQNLSSFIAAGTITQAILDDPNTVLRNAIAGQTIVETITLQVASASEVPINPVAIPAVGGGNANIAFLTGNADVPNAQPAPENKIFAGAKATFWIETVEHEITVPVVEPGRSPVVLPTVPHPPLGAAGPAVLIKPPFPLPHPITIRVHSTQIQYSQVVLLNFNGLTWPHVTVGTLVPSTPITPPANVWEDVRKTL